MNADKFKKISATFILLVVATFTVNAHIPGPNYIYKCPKCSNYLKRGSNVSGNTFGATLYSDGKMIAPMLPEFPDLTKCEKCDTILWLSDMEKIGTCEEWDNKKCKPEWKNASKVEFLGVNDLVRFLELDSVKNDKEKERIVRQEIWWAFNDRIRAGNEIFIQETDEDLWRQNCLRLIELFDDMTDINQVIMTAELYRNLGKFDECIKLMDSVDKDYDWIIQKFKSECANKNKLLIEL